MRYPRLAYLSIVCLSAMLGTAAAGIAADGGSGGGASAGPGGGAGGHGGGSGGGTGTGHGGGSGGGSGHSNSSGPGGGGSTHGIGPGHGSGSGHDGSSGSGGNSGSGGSGGPGHGGGSGHGVGGDHGGGSGHDGGHGHGHHHGGGHYWDWTPFGMFGDLGYGRSLYEPFDEETRRARPDGDENIELRIRPENAAVYVNGLLYSSRGRGRFSLPTGPWKIEIRAPGYVPQVLDLEVVQGVRYTIERTLAKDASRDSRGRSLPGEELGPPARSTR